MDKKLFIPDMTDALRVPPEIWEGEAGFADFLSGLKPYRGALRELWLFTASVHTPLRLGDLEKRAAVLKPRMTAARAAGWRAGINVLATIGHHLEDAENCLMDYTPMMGRGGETCHGSYCPNDESFINGYVPEAYRLLAESEPDFIMIDDDIRSLRYGVAPCFCDNCIRKFNAAFRKNFAGRGELARALDSRDITLRRDWLRFFSGTVTALLKRIRGAVDLVNPEIVLGLCTGERPYEGYDFAAWAEALSGGGREVMWRPGGGAYTDENLAEILEKAGNIARQNSLLQPFVTMSRAEIENCPSQLIQKSPKSVFIEQALYIAAGSPGIAYNILSPYEDPSVYNVHFAEAKKRAFFTDALRNAVRGKTARGVWAAWHPHSPALMKGGWYPSMECLKSPDFAREIFEAGIPQAFSRNFGDAVLVSGDMPLIWTDEEILSALKGGVWADGGALSAFAARGFGGLTGFSAGERIPADALERFEPHPFNAGLAGYVRNARQMFIGGEVFAIAPSPGAQVLSSIVDYRGKPVAPCASGLFENKLGGRVFASGCYPFLWTSDTKAALRVKTVLDWLSKGGLTSRADAYARVKNYTFEGEGGLAVLLLNNNLHALENLPVRVRAARGAVKALFSDGRESRLAVVSDGGGQSRFVIDYLPPWEMVLITFS